MIFSQNCINEIIYQKNVTTATTSFYVDVSFTNNIRILLKNVQFVSPASGNTLLLQTGQSSGAFATSGYQSGVQYAQYNNNSWSNQNTSTGFILSFYETVYQTNNYYAVHYIYGLNTTQPATQSGICTQYSATTTIFAVASGLSPTPNVSFIQFQTTPGATISSGLFTVYGQV